MARAALYLNYDGPEGHLVFRIVWILWVLPRGEKRQCYFPLLSPLPFHIPSLSLSPPFSLLFPTLPSLFLPSLFSPGLAAQTLIQLEGLENTVSSPRVYIEDGPATDDRPTSHLANIGEISNGHLSARGRPIHFMFGSTWGFRGRRMEWRYFRFRQIQDGGSTPSWKIQMAISQRRIVRFTPCLVLGWGFRGRRIEWRYFRFRQIQDGGSAAIFGKFKWRYLCGGSSDLLRV